MQKETRPTILILVLGLVVLFALAYLFYQSGKVDMPEAYATATAVLSSPTGETVGKVVFQESPKGVLIMAEARGLSPGGHALHIHRVGTCSSGISASRDHIDSSDAEHELLTSPEDGQDPADDLPNIYAAADGTARADFFTSEISIKSGEEHSVFDADGSTIIVHEKPDTYAEDMPDMGSQVACGVIIVDPPKKSRM